MPCKCYIDVSWVLSISTPSISFWSGIATASLVTGLDALAGRVPLRRQDRVCAVLSGGNVDRDRFDVLVAAAAPFDGEGGTGGASASS